MWFAVGFGDNARFVANYDGRMKTVLFAWECGANFGHLTRDLPLARALAAAGYRCVFAVKDVAIAAAVLGDEFAFVQCPLPSEPRPAWFPANHAEFMFATGYGDAAALLGLVQAWRALFVLTGAALVLADHAPSVLLAARSAAIPAIPLGTGFEVPPAVVPFPFYSRPTPGLSARGAEHAQRALRSANVVLGKLAQKPLAHLGELYPPDQILLLTSPLLDHYGARASACYVGQHAVAPAAQADITWSGAPRLRVFAYLRAYMPQLSELLDALAQAPDAEIIIAIPDMAPAQAASFSQGSLRVVPNLVALDALWHEASVVLSYGGHGLVSRAVETGKPTLILPGTVEQWLLATRVSQQLAHIRVQRQPFAAASIWPQLQDLAAIPGQIASPAGFVSWSASAALRHIERVLAA